MDSRQARRENLRDLIIDFAKQRRAADRLACRLMLSLDRQNAAQAIRALAGVVDELEALEASEEQ